MKRELPLHQGKNNKERSEGMAQRKELFLRSYEEWGTVRKCCEIVGIQRVTYDRWHREDLEFSTELDRMKVSFAESLEEIALERVRNPDKGKGSDLLLIALLNAALPQKYRPQFAMTEDSAKELIVEWRKAAKDVKKETEEAPAELPNRVENTLTEILERRGSAPEKEE